MLKELINQLPLIDLPGEDPFTKSFAFEYMLKEKNIIHHLKLVHHCLHCPTHLPLVHSQEEGASQAEDPLEKAHTCADH